MSEQGTVIVGQHWCDRRTELTYVTRCIAGAASRCGPVNILVPGVVHQREPDGAFDLMGIGEVGQLQWPRALSSDHAVVVDELTPELAAILARVNPRIVLYLTSSTGNHDPAWRQLQAVSSDVGGSASSVAVYVPVNPLATLHRHHGFGFTGYQLVLSGRPTANQTEPPSAAAWISAAFHDAYVIVVENALAAAWKGRVLRGTTSVDTRMDLWRLIAHANVCVDLDPGPQIARECIESLRYGTPIIVPEDSGAAAVHAREGGGWTFSDPGELLSAMRRVQTEADRSAVSNAGRRYADSQYGDPGTLVMQVRALLTDD
jgi:hypothetical protein